MDGILDTDEAETDPLTESLTDEPETEDAVLLTGADDGKLMIGELDCDAPEVVCETDAALSVTDTDTAPEVWLAETTELPDTVVITPPDVILCD